MNEENIVMFTPTYEIGEVVYINTDVGDRIKYCYDIELTRHKDEMNVIHLA